MNYLITKCVCDGTEFRQAKVNNIPVNVCIHCEGMHQIVAMDVEQYSKYYEEDYHSREYKHTYAHDYDVAKLRIEKYLTIPNFTTGRLMDYGSGNGAFVNATMDHANKDVVGVEISNASIESRSNIYNQDLHSVNFPTDHFDVVTMHDVLEHLVDPVEACQELFRITKQEGYLIVDFPDFFSKDGLHHWKKTEHLWFMSNESLSGMMQDAGFRISKIEQPVPGKNTFYFKKPVQDRVSILVPPGIGDSFWSLTKIKSFCDKYSLGLPDVFIQSPDDKERSLEFVRKFPILNAAGYIKMTNRHPVFQEAYLKNGRHVFENVAGCNFFLGFNGGLRFKKSMDDMLPECPTDWYTPMHESLRDKEQQQVFKERFGQYIVAYFVPHGMYKSWLKEFPVASIIQSLQMIQKELGCKVVFMGARWDANSLPATMCKDNEDFIDLTDQTDMDQMFALIKASMGVVGFPAGNTIIATILKKPTLLFWNKYFCEEFFQTSCPPDSYKDWYDFLNTAGCTPEKVRTTFLNLLSRHL